MQSKHGRGLDHFRAGAHACQMHVLLSVLAASLIAVGLVGAVVPALPGIPLIFGGIWLIAGMDHYRHIGLWWLLCIALLGRGGLFVILLGGHGGATRGRL